MKAVCFHDGMGPDDGVFQLSPLGNGSLRADDAGFSIDVGVRVDQRIGVNGVVTLQSEVIVNGSISVWVADVKPIAFIENHRAESTLAD